MRYRLKTLLLVPLLVSLGFFSIEVYKAIRTNYRNNLKPSLYAFLINREMERREANFERDRRDGAELVAMSGSFEELKNVEPSRRVYLAIGRSKDGKWIEPADSLLEKIGVETVYSVTESQPVFFVENLRWSDWCTATLDYGIQGCGGAFSLDNESTQDAVLIFENDQWKLLKKGTVKKPNLGGGSGAW